MDAHPRAGVWVHGCIGDLVRRQPARRYRRWRQSPRVHDPFHCAAAHRDHRCRVGWREGGLQSPLVRRSLRVLPGADVPVFQRQCALPRRLLRSVRHHRECLGSVCSTFQCALTCDCSTHPAQASSGVVVDGGPSRGRGPVDG